jgi:hypothetical protein
MPGDAQDTWIGLGLWIAIHGALATFLFETTFATFDRCLGRVPESDLPPSSRGWEKRLPRFEACLNDDLRKVINRPL